MPTLDAHPSQDGILAPGLLSSPSNEVGIIYGMASLPVFAHKGPALGPCHAGRHSSAFQRPAAQPDNSGPSPARRAGLREQSSVDSQAALTPEEFQKWDNARPAWASQAAAQSGSRKAVVGGCLCSCLVGISRETPERGGGQSGCTEKREELKKTQAVCEQA